MRRSPSLMTARRSATYCRNASRRSADSGTSTVTCREARGPDAAAGHVSTQGWPFLIRRPRTQDHRIVVIPGFMSRDLAAALRSRAVGEPLPPGSAFLRELRGAPAEPVAVVYRVWVPNAREYGLPGDGPLMDKHGRPILMAEGIALRGPAAAA